MRVSSPVDTASSMTSDDHRRVTHARPPRTTVRLATRAKREQTYREPYNKRSITPYTRCVEPVKRRKDRVPDFAAQH